MDNLTESYCQRCKRPLAKSDAVDENHAWCDACEAVVTKSCLHLSEAGYAALWVVLGGYACMFSL